MYANGSGRDRSTYIGAFCSKRVDWTREHLQAIRRHMFDWRLMTQLECVRFGTFESLWYFGIRGLAGGKGGGRVDEAGLSKALFSNSILDNVNV